MIKVRVRPVVELQAPMTNLAAIDKVVKDQTDIRLVPRYEQQVRTGVLSETPGPPAGTFKDKATPKQRRYVMMLIRKGIWTGRTNRMVNAWQLRTEPMQGGGIALIVENTAVNERGQPYAPYVTGEYQQTFHADTGWRKAAGAALFYLQDMAEEVADIYQEAVLDW